MRTWLAAGFLLATFAGQALVAVRRDSVTVDEFLHLPVGLHVLYTGDFRQDPIDPHVPLAFAALPLLANPPSFSPPPDANGFEIAYHFMAMNGARYQEIFESARMMIILVALAAAIVAARWGSDLYGEGAGLATLGLFAFSPSLLAHGHLVTLDMAGTLGVLLALYANWRFLDSPTWRRAAVVGVAMGFANLLKLSGVALVAMVLATWLVRAVAERRGGSSWQRWSMLLGVTGLAAIVTLNIGYGFDGTFGLLREATLAPGGILARLAAAVPSLRLPFPRPFLDGVDMVLEVGKGHDPSYFLNGQLSADGWWYYHLAAFAAKCPLPVLLGSFFAVGAWLSGRSPGVRDYALFLPVVVLFAMNSAFNSLDIGERHVLAAYPLLFIAISPWIAGALSPVVARLRTEKQEAVASPEGGDDESVPAATLRCAWPAAVVTAVLALWYVAGTLWVAPRYIQYFNELAGGPEGGHRVLVDSNIDWGQDLIRLREYMDANHVDKVALAYFGRVDPAIYGIRFTPLEKDAAHGTVAISASFLMGRPYFWFLGGRMRWVPSRTYTWLQAERPVARVGSMFVYDLP